MAAFTKAIILTQNGNCAGEVEADETYQSSGKVSSSTTAKGRRARRRGLKLKGRGTAARDRPPIFGLVQRRSQR